MEWCELLAQLEGTTEQRLVGLSLLQGHNTYRDLERQQLDELVEALVSLAKDSNYTVCVGALAAMQDLAESQRGTAAENLNRFVSVVVDRLGLSHEAVRIEAVRTLLAFMAATSPAQVLEYAGHVWGHKNWRVKAGMAEVVVGLSGQYELSQQDIQDLVITPLVVLLGGPSSHVKDAAIAALEVLHEQLGDELSSALDACDIHPGLRDDIELRLRPPAVITDGQSISDAGSGDDNVSKCQPLANPDSPRMEIMAGASRVSVAAVAATVSKPRRGGFQDAGGIAASSDWPTIVPVAVQSERELKTRVEQIINSLDAKVDWNKRVESLVLLEGLVLGGAPDWDGFSEALRVLREPLKFQLNDRRSAVSKQACHLLATLAERMGFQIEKHAVYFLSEVFKILVISVQVMAEAADMCASAFVRHCHSHRLLPIICNVICTDRNAKLRQICTAYLFQVLEGWDRQDYERCIDSVERALIKASQDALNETRAAARLMFGAYAVAWPERVSSLLQQLDTGLQAKMRQAALSYVPGPAAVQQSPQAPQMRRLSSGAGNLGSPVSSNKPAVAQTARKPPQPARSPLKKSRQDPMPPLQVVRSPERATPHAKSSWGRKSFSGTALRVSAGEFGSVSRQPSVAASLDTLRLEDMRGELPALPPRRMTADHGLGPASMAFAGQDSGVRRASAPGSADLFRPDATPGRPAANQPKSQRRTGAGGLPPLSGATYGRVTAQQQQHFGSDAVRASCEGLQWLAIEPQQAVPSAAEILQSARAGAGDWREKLELLAKIEALAAADPGDLASPAHADKIADILIEQSGHPHNKVAVAALEAMHEMISAIPEFWTGQRLWRLIPPLLLRTVDVRDAVCKAASSTLADIGSSYQLVGLLPGLVQTLNTSKAPKVVCACLRCFLSYANVGLEYDAAMAPALRSWQMRIEKLAKDKNAEIRQVASRVLQALLSPLDSGPSHSPGHGTRSSPPGRYSMAQLAGQGASSPGQSPVASARRAHGTPRQPSMDPNGCHTHIERAASCREERLGATTGSCEGRSPLGVRQSMASMPSAADRHLQNAAETAAGNPDSPLQHAVWSQSLDHQASSSPVLSGRGSDGQAVTNVSSSTAGAANYGEVPVRQPGHHKPNCNGSVPRIPSLGQEGEYSGQHHAAQHPQVVELRAMAGRGMERCPSNASSDSIEFFDAVTDPGQSAAITRDMVQTNGHALAGEYCGIDDSSQMLEPMSKSHKSLAFEDAEALIQKLLQCTASMGQSPSAQQLLHLGSVLQSVPQTCILAFRTELLDVILAGLRAADVDAHGRALMMLLDLLGKQGFMVEASIAALQLVTCLLACSASPSSQVQKMAEEALQQLTKQMPGPVCMEVLLASLPKSAAEDAAALGPSMQAAIKAITRTLNSLPAADLRQVLEPLLLPALFHAMSHASAEVRKAAVFCLADLWQLLGESSITSLLKPLNPGQMKLISIYANRAAKSRQGGHATKA